MGKMKKRKIKRKRKMYLDYPKKPTFNVNFVSGQLDANEAEQIKCLFLNRYLKSKYYELMKKEKNNFRLYNKQPLISIEEMVKDRENKNKENIKKGGFPKRF